MISIDLRLTFTTAQRNAWTLIRPVLRPYLVKVFRVYRNATPEQQAVLRAHCTILDAVLTMLGE